MNDVANSLKQTETFLGKAIPPRLIIAIASGLLIAYATHEIANNPDVTDTQLLELVDGDVKHSLRGKVGFLADFAWYLPSFRQELDTAATAAIAEARAKVSEQTALAEAAATEARALVDPAIDYVTSHTTGIIHAQAETVGSLAEQLLGNNETVQVEAGETGAGSIGAQ